MLNPDIKPGEVAYRFRVICDADREFAFIETWLYLGYVKRKCNSFDCDKPYWYYRFKNITEKPIAAEDAVVDFPSWKQLENMFSLDELEREISFFRQELRTTLVGGDKPMKTEQVKMLAGELYNALDPQLVEARERARDLCHDLNATREREQAVRRRILTELLGSGGDSVWLQPPFFCDYGSHIYLGERVYFNFNCVVLDVCEVRIGDFAFFGPAVQIYTATHPMDAHLRRTQEFGKPVTIGSDVWVGGGAIICPGVTIGSKSVIGAGSVVTRDVPEGVFAAGNPCRVIRTIAESERG